MYLLVLIKTFVLVRVIAADKNRENWITYLPPDFNLTSREEVYDPLMKPIVELNDNSFLVKAAYFIFKIPMICCTNFI